MKTPLGTYLKQTLQPGEAVLATGGIHPAYLIAPAVTAGTIAWAIVWAFDRFDVTETLPAAWWVLLLPAAYFIQSLLVWATTEAALTNCRVVSKSGFISRRISEIALSKIESTAIDQGVIGRAFGFGDLVIHGSGGHAATAPGLGQVLQFRAAVQNAAP